MSKGECFWIIYLIIALGGGLGVWTTGNRWWFGASLAGMLLIGLLGVAVFGWPIK